MITTKAPIGEIINYVYKNPHSYKDRDLLKKIESLIDLIIIRTNKNGINSALESLLDDIFKLRFDIINDSELVTSIFEDLNSAIEDRIKQQFNKSTKHKELEQAFVNAINIYGQIASSIIAKISNKPFVAINNLSSYQYDDIVVLLNSLPGRESQFILSYIQSSITLDYSFVTSELVFDNELKLKNSEIEYLRSLLKNSIEEFAVYSNLFDLWTPDECDESQWMRNIKIRISTFESLFLRDKLSSDDINKILAA